MCDSKKKYFLLEKNAQKGAFLSIGIDGSIDKGRHRTVAASEEATRRRHVNGGWRGAEGKFF